MSKIDKLGGYKNAKEAYEFLNSCRWHRTPEQGIDALGAELLEYRRANSIFEVGDKVTLSKWANDFSRSHNGIYEILSFENDLETLALLSQDIRSSTQHIKHATDEEIKAGHRL